MTRHLVLGTAGHVDHGKTALVAALTGVDTDRLAEEKRRGITIDLGFAELPLGDDLTLGIVDVPGHEAFVRNMLAGATGIDLVLLVVAADEGVMPQTTEHLDIVRLLGVRGGVVALTKTDLVEPAWLELVQEELTEHLAATPFAGAPVVPVSSRDGRGLDELRAALAGAAAAVPDRPADGRFRMPVDRVFTIRGTGTVVTGTVWHGALNADASPRVLPSGRTSRVRGLQVHGREVDRILAGQRAAVALAGLDTDEVQRGDVLVDSPDWTPSSMLTVRLSVVPDSAWSIAQRQRVRVHLGTAEALARVALLEPAAVEGGSSDADTILGPGQTTWAQLRLESPLVARAGDRLVVRSYSPVTTIGGAVVAEPVPRKRKRLREPDRSALDAILDGDAAAAAAAAGRLAGRTGIPAASLDLLLPGSGRESAEGAEGGAAEEGGASHSRRASAPRRNGRRRRCRGEAGARR